MASSLYKIDGQKVSVKERQPSVENLDLQKRSHSRHLVQRTRRARSAYDSRKVPCLVLCIYELFTARKTPSQQKGLDTPSEGNDERNDSILADVPAGS